MLWPSATFRRSANRSAPRARKGRTPPRRRSGASPTGVSGERACFLSIVAWSALSGPLWAVWGSQDWQAGLPANLGCPTRPTMGQRAHSTLQSRGSMPSPQKLRWAKLRIFVVAVSALSVLSVLTYLLSGGTWLKAKAYLTTYIPDSTGLEPGADVLLNGVKIGRVESVQLTRLQDRNRIVEVRLKIEEVFLPYIPEDSVTTIDSANLLGDEYININMGRSPQPVRAGGQLRFPPPSNLMQNIDLRQFEAQLRTIDQIIQDIQAGKGPLGQFVMSDDLYRQFLDGVDKVEKELRAATGSQSQLGQVLYNATMHDNLSASLRQLDDRLAQLQANRLLRDTTQYDQIRDQIAQVRRTLADLNAGKGAGGEFLKSDAAYVEWNRRLAAWIENVDALNSGEGSMGQMLSNAQTYESLNGALRDLQSTMKEFREDPQKFLRLKIF